MSASDETAASLIAGLDRGESLPSRWYTDQAITDREIQAIFRKTWSYIGPLNELKNIGDYITGMVGEIPVVVIRNESGLAALVNVCRHRRHQVMKGRGNAQMMQCGYHAWTYDLAGCLKGAPRTAQEPGFRLEDYPLLPLRVDTLGPWVFVNADKDAEPIASQYGELLDVIARTGLDLDSLQLYSRTEWEAPANWKTMLENYEECYHCAVAHPGFSAAIDVLPGNYHLAVHGWFMTQAGHVRKSALEGKAQVKIYNARGSVEQAQYHLLFPNMTININPGFPNLSIDIWRPNGANATKGFSEQYFGPGVSKEWAEELIEFNSKVGEEDDDLTNSVQIGLRAGIPERGRFLTGAEHLVGHFQKLVAASVVGTAAELKAVGSFHDAEARNISVQPTASAAPESERNTYVDLEVFKVEPESDLITSFYLRRADGKPLYSWAPGQFLPIRVKIPGQEPALRTYTLSTSSNPDHYRLSIRRGDGDALVSRFLHANARPGSHIEAIAPRGRFVLSGATDRPVVLISGGVGITPMMAMAEHIVAESKRTGKFRPVQFIHGAQSSKVQAFGARLDALAAEHPGFKRHLCYSKPCGEDVLGKNYDSNGYVDTDTVRKMLASGGDHEFYLCGPQGFMKSLFDGLTGMGVPADRIFYESFGPATVFKAEGQAAPARAIPAGDEAVPVRFVKSNTGGDWSRDRGTLLEFAESIGLAPQFSCRSGICGTCKTRIVSGAVDYVEEPVAPRGPGEVLLCCSVPRPGTDVFLDL
jgi:ferredoxin-NADP reductase/phenylpropionate dioxygenase-like ring-hydroxylating dioxygenase large terminal subunit/ferredoxin